jgi:CRP-like cAMP-binding protein
MGDTWAEPENEPLSETFWAVLDSAERGVLRRVGVTQRFGRGEYLCVQGDLLRHVYVLLSGSVEIVVDASSGYEGVVAVRGPGDIVGEFAAVDGKPRSATMRALDRVEAIVVAADRFAALCQSRPRLTWAVLMVVVGRLRDLSTQRTEDGGRSATERLAALLLELARRYGVRSAEGITIGIPLTQKSMAGLIAASRESVVRGLSQLRQRRLITTRHRQVTILRPGALWDFQS